MPDEDNTYYKVPESHNDEIKKMVTWLAIFFSILLISIIVFIVNAHRILIHLPFSAEKQFVKPYETIADKYFGDKTIDSSALVIEEYLNELGASLVLQSDMPKDIEVTFHFLDNPTMNAFATLGGHIFICRGLLEQIPDENSLAMVMAHEIAHIKQRDPIVGLGRGLAIQMIYSFATGDYSNSQISGMGSEMGLMFFSREQEERADDIGLSILNKKYGHIGGFNSFFQWFIDNKNPEQTTELEWMSSHPDLTQRIAYLEAIAEANHWKTAETQTLPILISESLSDLNKIDLGLPATKH
jgi:beta-barrel assembly-enhancing protease